MPAEKTTNRDGSARDNQRQKVYDAEDAARAKFGSWGHTIKNADLQAFVDKVMINRAVQARWGQIRITVGLTHGGGHAHVYSRQIDLGTYGRNPAYVLHEIAHILAYESAGRRVATHGPEFVGVLKFLYKTILGKEAYDLLVTECRSRKVRSNNQGVPDPEPSRVRTQAERARALRERQATDQFRARSAVRRAAAAETIKALVAHGDFGPVGSKERNRALALARKVQG